MKYTVKTPVEGFNGIAASLRFSDGVYEGEITNPNILNYFNKKGYTVIEHKETTEKPKTTRTRKKKEDDNNV